MSTPTLANLKRAITLTEKIDALKAELNSLLGGGDWSGSGSVQQVRGKRGRPSKNVDLGTESVEPPVKRKKRKLSPEALEKIREGQRRRWAKVKKAGKSGSK